jgi:hypothetical protein
MEKWQNLKAKELMWSFLKKAPGYFIGQGLPLRKSGQGIDAFIVSL